MRSTHTAFLLVLALPATATSQILRDPSTPRTLTAIPTGAPPSPLTASPGTTSIYLRWGCPDGATGYDVYVTPSGGVQAKLTPSPIPAQCVQDVQRNLIVTGPLATAPTSPTYSMGFTHAGAVPGASYTYVVVARYSTGAQGSSTPVGVQANPLPGPTVSAVATAGRNAVVTWAASSGATGYQIHRKLAGQSSFQYLSLQGNAATSYTDPTVLPPGQHQYVVQAANGLPSSPVTVTLPGLPAPSGVRVQDFGSYVTIYWQAVPGAAGYLVFRQLQGETGFSQITATPLKSFFNGPELMNQPPNGQRVGYYVKAVDGDPSAPVSIVPGVPSWSQVRMYPGSNTLDLNWRGSSRATSVKVLRAGSPAGPFMEVPATQYSSGEARVSGNPIGVVQYFKVQSFYPTGAAESVVIPVTIKSEPKGESCYGTVNEKGTVTWQFVFCN